LCIDARLSDDVTRALQEKNLNCIIKSIHFSFYNLATTFFKLKVLNYKLATTKEVEDTNCYI